MTEQIVILGQDGAGKSTLVKRLREHLENENKSVLFINAPDFHRGVDAPFSQLSEDLEFLSHLSDELGAFHLKAVALFLQVSLYGPVEETLRKYLMPDVIIGQRHPAFDVLIYAKFYRKYLKQELLESEWDSMLETKFKAQKMSWFRVKRWYSILAVKADFPSSIWEFPHALDTLLSKSDEVIMSELEKRFDLKMPQRLILIDLDPAEALKRIHKRDGEVKELHENLETLKLIRESYLTLMESLKVWRPELKTTVISSDQLSTKSAKEILSILLVT